MTPMDALEGRDRLAESAALMGAGKGTWTDWESRRLGQQTEQVVLEAQVLIWRKDLWLASQGGWTAFVGQPAAELATVPPQLWFFSEEWQLPEHPWCEFTATDRELQPFSGVLLYPCWPTGKPAPQMSLVAFSWTRGPGPRQGTVHFAGAGSVRFDRNFEDRMAPLAAGLKFLDLSFVGKEPGHFAHHVRRAAEMKRRPPLPEVNAVVLRRSHREEAPAGSGHTEWSCSWVRSAHWRRQWYPSLETHRPIYIAPQLLGDPTKPLHNPKGIIYDVRR